MDTQQELSIKEIRERGQSTAPEAGRDPYVGSSIRFFSPYITKIALRLNITPNQMTFISVCVFFAGVSMYFFNSIELHMFGCVLIYLSVVLDGVDGELARIAGNKTGVGGIYAEPLSHDIQYGLMFFPLAIGLYIRGADPSILIVGWVAAVAKLLYRFLIVRFDQVLINREQVKVVIMGTEGDATTLYNTEVSLPHKIYRWFNRNIFSSVCLVVPLFLLTLFGHVDWFIWLFVIGFSLIACAHLVRQILYVSRLGKKER